MNLSNLIDTDPYTARKAYVAIADQLLRKIPGEHHQVMDSWPKWQRAKSPPPPGGNYPNRAWEKANSPKPPKVDQAKPEPVQGNADGPTLRERPIQKITADEQHLPLPAVENKRPLLLEASEAQVGEPAIAPPVKIENTVPEVSGDAVIPETSISSVQGPLMIEAAPDGPEMEPVDATNPEIAVAEDKLSSAEAESSVDPADVFAGIKGIRPDAPAIGDAPEVTPSSMNSSGAIVKHFAVMAGIS